MTIKEWRLQDLGAESQVLREGLVPESGLEIGRTAMGMGCPDDPQMSARHARLSVRDGAAFVEELGSTTGVWLRVPSGEGCALRVDDQVWLGAQILLIRRRGEAWELRHHGPDGRLREKHLVPDAGVFLGRTSDLVLDQEDSRLSRRHAQIVREGDGLHLYDRGAHNGTYLKLVEPVALRDGDELRIATHRFRVEAVPDVMEGPAGQAPDEARQEPLEGATVLRAAPVRAPIASKVQGQAGEGAPASGGRRKKKGGLAARLKRMGRSSEQNVNVQPVDLLGETLPPSTRREDVPKTGTAPFEISLETAGEAVSVPAAAGQTILEAVRAAGLARGEPVDWECGDGGCGVCVMGLVGGGAGLEPPDPEGDEMKTIQITEQVTPDPESYRLACLARVRGNVRLRRL